MTQSDMHFFLDCCLTQIWDRRQIGIEMRATLLAIGRPDQPELGWLNLCNTGLTAIHLHDPVHIGTT